MKKEYIDVDSSWGVVMCYDLRRLDEYEMRSLMMALGVRGPTIDEAVDILLYSENTGMCVTSFSNRMSLVFIGEAEDEEQWWDTVSHELFHVTCAICEYYGVSLDSEDGAWTMGYLMRKAVEQIAEPCKTNPGD